MDAGVIILMAEGFRSLTIARLLKAVGVTKGSFYHHFAGIDDYLASFLDYYEQDGTLNIIEICNAEPTPRKRLLKLIQISTSYPARASIVMRVWAGEDARVREVQERTDARRLAYLEEQFRPITEDAELAKTLASLMYSILIGSEHTMPPLSDELQRNLFYTALAPWGITPEPTES